MERPFPAYSGPEPYVFVCYAHEDAELVYPEILRLRESGFRIWYDEGIPPGLEWSQQLADHIEGCAVFLFFVTPRSVEREHCRREVNFALEQQCSILAVHLEPTEVPSAIKLSLSNRQAVLRYELSSARYQQKLDTAITHAAAGRSLVAEGDGGPGPYRLGEWEVDPTSGTLRNGECERHLPPQTMAVLAYLVRHAGEIVSNDELLENVWRGRFTADDSVYHHIGRIRKALGDSKSESQYIETIPRRGYRLVASAMPGEADATSWQESKLFPTRIRTIAPFSIVDPGVPGSKRHRYVNPIGLLMACIALAAVTVTWWLSSRPEPTGHGVESSFRAVAGKRLIVLPFANLGSSPGDGYLADGLTEELITVLGRIDMLRVIPRTSSFYFKNRAYDLVTLADALDVSHAIEGSVRRADDDVRVTARLLETRSGTEVASLVVDRKLANLLQLHREVATSIVDALAMHLSDTEIDSAIDAGTGSDAAFSLFLRAEELARQDNLEAWRKAKELYRAAIALDPTFHRAYYRLGDAIVIGDGYRGRRWERAAEDHLALREQIERLHARRTDPWWNRHEWDRYWVAGDFPAAEATAAQALRGNSTDVFWLEMYAQLLADAGLIDASLEYWRLVQRVDPFNPRGFEGAGTMLAAMGRYDEAVAALDRCLALAPGREGCIGEKEMVFSAMGRYELAESLRPGQWGMPLCLSPDHHAECRTLVQDGVDDLPIPVTFKGYAAMLGGDLDAAFEYLDEAADQPFSFVRQVRWQNYGATEPFLRDPRYDALLDKLGLTDEWQRTLCRRAQALTPATGVPVTCSTD